MNEAEGIIRILQKIQLDHPGLGSEDVLLCGSAAMVLSGVARGKPVNDIDLFMATKPWFSLLESGEWLVYAPPKDDPKRRSDPPYLYRIFPFGVDGKDVMEVNIFFEWRTRGFADIEVREWFDRSVRVRGIQTVPMPMMLQWKEEASRKKDISDIEAIKQHLRFRREG